MARMIPIAVLLVAVTVSAGENAPAPTPPALPPAPAPNVPPPSAADIDGWIAQLGADEFEKRLEGERKLEAVSEHALGAMDKALGGTTDPEVKTRLTRLVTQARVAPVLKKLAAYQPKTETVEYDALVKGPEGGGEEGGPLGISEMKLHFKGKGDKKHYRMDMSGKEGGADMKATLVADGTYLWMEMALPEALPGGAKTMVNKMPLTMNESLGMDAMFGQVDPKEIVKDLEVTKAIEEIFKGTEVYAIEGNIKKQPGGGGDEDSITNELLGFHHIRMLLRRNDLHPIKVDYFDIQNKAQMSLEISNLKKGLVLEESVFKYTPPEGAHVIDMEKMGEGADDVLLPGERPGFPGFGPDE